MVRKTLIVLLGLTSLWVGSRTFCQEELKIGFISLKKVSDESLKKKAFEDDVKKLFEEKKPLRDAIRKEISDLETAKALSGPEQAKKDEERITQKKLELARFDGELRQDIEKRQLTFEREILRDIAEAVKEVAEEKGYTWVLVDEVLLYKDKSADLTFQVLVKMNEKYIAGAESKPEVEEKPSIEEGAPAAKPLPVSVEDALIEDVLKNGVRDRYTIKEIQPRNGSSAGSVTMRGEGERLRFVSQYPKDMSVSGDAVVTVPMGDKSVWRFVGTVSLSGYTFKGDEGNRPLTFILVDEIGLVHLYGKGSVVSPDGHTAVIEEKKPLLREEVSGSEGEAK